MKRFVYAFRGIFGAVKTEVNMRVHICFAIYTILAGFVCRISPAEWTAVLLCIGSVLALECVNTAIETLCDEVRPEKNPRIKIVKDSSAGAVLCLCAAAAIVGGNIFFRDAKTYEALLFLKTRPLMSGAIIASLIPAVFFVFWPLKKIDKE